MLGDGALGEDLHRIVGEDLLVARRAEELVADHADLLLLLRFEIEHRQVGVQHQPANRATRRRCGDRWCALGRLGGVEAAEHLHQPDHEGEDRRHDHQEDHVEVAHPAHQQLLDGSQRALAGCVVLPGIVAQRDPHRLDRERQAEPAFLADQLGHGRAERLAEHAFDADEVLLVLA
ncbi:hypothetical protein D9M71_381630 [compost metagenome]